jgi:hypothetical protein
VCPVRGNSWQPSRSARAISIFPVVRNAAFAQHEAQQLSEACLSPNIVGEKQHTASMALRQTRLLAICASWPLLYDPRPLEPDPPKPDARSDRCWAFAIVGGALTRPDPLAGAPAVGGSQ